MAKTMKPMRDMMDDYFIEIYKYFDGHMSKTCKVLGVTEHTARNWRHRLVAEGRIENITTLGNSSMHDNRLKMYDEFCNKKTLKKGSHKFKSYDLT